MPEYLSPGVYVEETSFRSKSIEGVSTSTAGFVGPARWGPVCGEPELITSQADFELYYGSLENLSFLDQAQVMPNYLAHGVRAFFEEGGQRLYVSRAFNFGTGLFTFTPDADGLPKDFYGRADLSNQLSLIARFPGAFGNMRVILTVRIAGSNALLTTVDPNDNTKRIPIGLSQIQGYSLVHVGIPTRDAKKRITGITPHNPAGATGASAHGLYLAHLNTKGAQPQWQIIADDGVTISTLDDLYRVSTDILIRPVMLLVEIETPTIDVQGIPGFAASRLLGEFGFDGRLPGTLMTTFVHQPTTRFEALTIPFAIEPRGDLKTMRQDLNGKLSEDEKTQKWSKFTLALAEALLNVQSDSSTTGTLLDNVGKPSAKVDELRKHYVLTGGSDGNLPELPNYEGEPEQFQDFLNDPLQSPKNGLLAFESVDDISIVAAPGYSANPSADNTFAIERAVIDHCEKMRYRVAVLDTPPGLLVSGALDFRNLTTTKYGALYYPWVTILNPLTDDRLLLPPSGFVAGIYARNDTEHAVFKAPANEVVRLAIDFEQRINKAQQDVLNPQGVNCFRYFPGHGFLLWGARTISDDPEWKYVSVRRYFAYLEHSIDRGTQWVVFENNGPQLWDNVRRTVEDFLLNEWKMGALLGDKPDQAYFVRCDRSTMTQNDLDNGRLVCLIGVAVVKPAEFVIFRIGQWTAKTSG